jgi:hypothetical protein
MIRSEMATSNLGVIWRFVRYHQHECVIGEAQQVVFAVVPTPRGSMTLHQRPVSSTAAHKGRGLHWLTTQMTFIVSIGYGFLNWPASFAQSS